MKRRKLRIESRMYAGKPIIGISGGIGSGKTFVAKLFSELGCLVISSDDMVHLVYKDSSVKQQLKRWWGGLVFQPNGDLDRSAVARKIFNSPEERKRLEHLIHPLVNQLRERTMEKASRDPAVTAFVWDTPLLFETHLDQHCDKLVFVDAPLELRQFRVQQTRGWTGDELTEREISQMPLDRKREMSHYTISNNADADYARGQVREKLTRILADSSQKTVPA